MSKIHRTARGDAVDMDMVRLANESTIAIGNMKTNARGDELGPGGKVIKTRSQIMQEYHRLNTSVAHDIPVGISPENTVATNEQPEMTNLATPVADDTPVTLSSATPQYVKPRGSFAESVAEQTEVTQELLEPAASRNSSDGITRI
jgi:hypothetical protein